MFKYIVSALLSFSTAATCYAQEVPEKVNLPFGVAAHPAMMYAAAGHIHLMVKDFAMALEDFRRASYYADASLDIETWAEVETQVLFGQVIAYDNLNDGAKCQQALNDLLDMPKDDDDEEEYDEEDAFWDNFTLKDAQEGATKLFTEAAALYFVGELYKVYYNLAALAPSEDVRITLIKLLDEERI